MSQEESKSPADPERETRALGAPIRNVEKAREVKNDSARAEGERLQASNL